MDKELNLTETLNGTKTPVVVTEASTLPGYICCAVTEGGWTWFASFILIFILFTAATLKHWKKTLSKPKFIQLGRELHLQRVIADDKGRAQRAIKYEAISVEEFQGFYAKRRKYKTVEKMELRNTLEIVGKLPIDKLSITMAKEEENMGLNQSTWAVPYDYNRVHLNRTDGRSDYINASYITNYKKEKAWIVTQGPLETTTQDFWEMVWQERSPFIIMLTKTFEIIQLLCVQYWPRVKEVLHDVGDFQIELLEEESYANYKVRSLKLSKNNSDEFRVIKQYQFFAWNLYSDPPPASVLQFRRRFKTESAGYQAKNLDALDGPTIVHCHDGGIRCGCFIAILDNLAMAEDRGEVDVFTTATRLVKERRSLICKPEQLSFIYKVLHDRFLCGDTFIPTKDILSTLQKKSKKSPIDGLNEYKREHKILSELVPTFTIGDCAAGHRAENRAKNRNTLIVPPDKHRPYLTSFMGNDATDYINAVYVDGFRMANEYICTEWPMSKTMGSFWSMVFDCDIKTIIVLNSNKSTVNVAAGFSNFWPQYSSKTKTYGHIFTVEQMSSTNIDGKFSFWELKLIKQDANLKNAATTDEEFPHLSNLLKRMHAPSRIIRLFQMHCWPNSQKIPNSTYALVNLINEVEKWRGNSKTNVQEDKVIVVSNDGYSRCGVYCAAAATLEQVYHDEEVDLFQAVKSARKNRPQLVANATEYKYCYDVILHYVLHYCRPK